MENLGLLLLLAIGGLIACIMLIVVGMTWNPGTRTNKPKAPGATPATTPVQATDTAPAPGQNGGAREVLRVLRDPVTEALVVELAGQRYTRLADIHLGSVREGLLTTLRDLEGFASGAATVPAVVMVPVPAPEPIPTAPPSLTNVGTLKPGKAGTGPLLAPSMNPFKQMLVLRDLAKTQLPPMKPIAEQIDDILQEKLLTSAYLQRGVKVHTGPKGNALFRADGQDYDAVDSVPDDEIRGLIRAAVAEWEQKQ